MRDIRELTTDELSAVQGGATNKSSLPHPEPSPVDRIIQWILGALK
jgi:bacteriocin-like protein